MPSFCNYNTGVEVDPLDLDLDGSRDVAGAHWNYGADWDMHPSWQEQLVRPLDVLYAEQGSMTEDIYMFVEVATKPVVALPTTEKLASSATAEALSRFGVDLVVHTLAWSDASALLCFGDPTQTMKTGDIHEVIGTYPHVQRRYPFPGETFGDTYARLVTPYPVRDTFAMERTVAQFHLSLPSVSLVDSEYGLYLQPEHLSSGDELQQGYCEDLTTTGTVYSPAWIM